MTSDRDGVGLPKPCPPLLAGSGQGEGSVIVCICNGLRDTICRATAASQACRGPGCIYRLNGARVRCGRCLPMMRELYLEHTPRSHGAAMHAPEQDMAIPT